MSTKNKINTQALDTLQKVSTEDLKAFVRFFKTKRTTIQVRIDREIGKQLHIIAKEEKITLSKLMDKVATHCIKNKVYGNTLY